MIFADGPQLRWRVRFDLSSSDAPIMLLRIAVVYMCSSSIWRESHVRCRESLEAKFLRATQQRVYSCRIGAIRTRPGPRRYAFSALKGQSFRNLFRTCRSSTLSVHQCPSEGRLRVQLLLVGSLTKFRQGNVNERLLLLR